MGIRIFRAAAIVATLLGCADAEAAVAHDVYLSFDGQNDIATVPNSASLSPTAQITVEAWINPATIATDKSQDRVISKVGSYELTISTGDTGCGFRTSGAVQWRATIAGVDGRICGGELTSGEWHHVAGTYDGTMVVLYVDGARVASAARAGAVAVSTAALMLGNRKELDRAFDGGLDEVRVWRRALTQTELQQNAKQLSGSETDLVAYYRADESSGQLLTDATPNGNAGTRGLSNAIEASDPGWSVTAANSPPTVDAGADQSIDWPQSSLQLYGTAQDDGLPSGTLTYRWTVASGAAAVNFQNATAAQTTATFAAPGTYVLSLQASDGAASAADTVEIRVVSQQSVASLEVIPRFVTLGRAETQTFSAIARDGNGKIVSVNPAWTASAGVISSAGHYTAPAQAGLQTIRATAAGVSGTAQADVTSSATVWPTSGWTAVTPATMNMNAATLAQARTYALTGAGSGMITRGGKVVMSWGDTALRYDVKSSTKSIGGTALGVALLDGLLSVDDAARTYLPTIGLPPDTNASTGWLDDIQLLHLATQTAGFDKAGGYTQLLFQPGTRWSYSDGGANWLADVLTATFHADLNSLLFARVFTPMGITSADLRWRANAYREDLLDGVKRRELGAGITVNVGAMARIGYMYLRRGSWAGQRMIPDSFVQQVQQPQPQVIGLPVRDPTGFPQASNHYGLLWWTNADSTLPGVPRDAFWSWGLGESLILVIPSLDIVAARAGNAWRTGPWTANYAVLDPFIMPIVKSVPPTITVPRVTGLSQLAATTAIAQAQLAVSAVTQQTGSGVPAGRVISQSPAAGTAVARNTGVKLVVAAGN
ncbi:MAG TPA: LamG-like jellyroll fold domain-containing protein [Steroidobacteraceae bacterium]|nr:LamG-like jellyroll fold domain-containing protein [Steroidobacteraceae bacterium]